MRAEAAVQNVVAELSPLCAYCGGELVFARVPLLGTVVASCADCRRGAPVRTRRPGRGAAVVPIDRAVTLADRRGSVTGRIVEHLPIGVDGDEPPLGALTIRELINAVRLSSGSVSGCLGKLQREGRVTFSEVPRRGNLGPTRIKLYWRLS